ncbi:MAG: TIGR03617 family F420-dependent LLM class oxidoreductase [Actinomycetes bacterium]
MTRGLRIDAPLVAVDLRAVPGRARTIESLGYHGAFTFEGPHDPFFPLALAAEHTEHIELTTAVAIALARSPMTVAQIGRDLNDLARGRAIIGLGSQVRAHIERRFSMPWSQPADRMREHVLALRAIWGAWQDRTPLRFEGEHYRHTLMTPFFDPGPSEHGIPRVHLAGVGARMTEVAGEVADGFLVHPFSTPEFVRDVTHPALARGAARAGRTLDGFDITWPIMVVSGPTEEAMAGADAIVRTQIAFYASTPAYRVVLEHHGYGALQPELQRMTREGRWDEMPTLVDDELLRLLAVVAEPGAVAAGIRERAGDLVDRVSVNAPYETDPGAWREVVTAIRAERTRLP